MLADGRLWLHFTQKIGSLRTGWWVFFAWKISHPRVFFAWKIPHPRVYQWKISHPRVYPKITFQQKKLTEVQSPAAFFLGTSEFDSWESKGTPPLFGGIFLELFPTTLKNNEHGAPKKTKTLRSCPSFCKLGGLGSFLRKTCLPFF